MIKVEIFNAFFLAMCEPSIHESCSYLQRFSFFSSKGDYMHTRIYLFLHTVIIDCESCNWLITMICYPSLCVFLIKLSHCSKVLNKNIFSPIFDMCTLKCITKFICRCIHNFYFSCYFIFLITCQCSLNSSLPKRMIVTSFYYFCKSRSGIMCRWKPKCMPTLWLDDVL